MIAEHPDSPEETLPSMLAARARRSSDARLAGDVAVGVVVALGMLVWRRGPWIWAVALGLALAAYGAWGIADRELRERTAAGAPPRPLVIARVVAAAVGALAGVAVLISALGVALGTWIS